MSLGSPPLFSSLLISPLLISPPHLLSSLLLSSNLALSSLKQHGKTAAQVLLRWQVQRGTSVIPKTTKKHRMAENIDIFDFELTAEEMKALDALDKKKRFNDPGDFCEGGFGAFCTIYD